MAVPAGPDAGDPRDDVIGRENELAAIDAFLAERPWPRMLRIEGDPGIGKTTVWEAACRMAAETGARVLTCSPVQPEVTFAFGGLVDLFEGVPDAALAGLPDAQRSALAIALRRDVPSEHLPDPLSVSAGARTAISALAGEGRLVLAIDDGQWLDPSTAAVLGYVLRRLTDEPIGVIVARRPHVGDDTVVAFDQGLVSIPVDRLRLAPMTLSSLHHVVRSRTGQILPRPALHRIADASGGNPLLALALVEALDAAPATRRPGDPLPTPGTLAEVVAGRVARLPVAAREVLLVVASLPGATQELVAGINGRDVAADLEAGRAAGILEHAAPTLRFAHPLYAQAIRSLAASRERQAVHGRIAALVAEPEEHGRHLALAVDPPDDVVARALEAGAEAALGRGALRAAAELLEHAQRFTSPAEASRGLQRAFRAAEHLILAGDRAAAGELLREVVDQAESPLRERATALFAEILVNQGSLDEAERLFRRALATGTAPAVTARINLDLAYLSLVRLDTAEAARCARLGAAAARHESEPALLAEALAYVALTTLLDGRDPDEATIEEALRLEDSTRPPYLGLSPSGVTGLIRALMARHDAARTLLLTAKQSLDLIGDDCDLAHVLLWSAWNELRAGRLRDAEELSEQGATIAETTGSELLRAWSCAVGALAAAGRGDPAAADRGVRDALRSGSDTSAIVVLWASAASCLARLSMGDWTAAAAAVAGMPIAELGAGMTDPVLGFFVPDAVEALARAGEIPRAGGFLAPFQAAAARRGRRWATAASLRAQAAIDAQAGDVEAAIVALRAAIALHDPVELPLERARALLHLGQLLRRAGERRAARAALEQAGAAFGDAGADGWARLAAAELGRVPGRRGPSETLTETERRVARLSGAGRTNREVATMLFVSPKTVEANLARVYRKLGIATRAELGAWLAREAETAGG